MRPERGRKKAASGRMYLEVASLACGLGARNRMNTTGHTQVGREWRRLRNRTKEKKALRHRLGIGRAWKLRTGSDDAPMAKPRQRHGRAASAIAQL